MTWTEGNPFDGGDPGWVSFASPVESPASPAPLLDPLLGALSLAPSDASARCPDHFCQLFQPAGESFVPSTWAVSAPAPAIAPGGAGDEAARAPLDGGGQLTTTALAVALGVLGLVGVPFAYVAWRIVPTASGGGRGRFGRYA